MQMNNLSLGSTSNAITITSTNSFTESDQDPLSQAVAIRCVAQ